MTTTKIVTPKGAPAKAVVKDASMLKQKDMMAAHYDRLTSAPETGAKVASTKARLETVEQELAVVYKRWDELEALKG